VYSDKCYIMSHNIKIDTVVYNEKLKKGELMMSSNKTNNDKCKSQ